MFSILILASRILILAYLFWLRWWLRRWNVCLKCGRPSSFAGLGRSPGEGNGNQLQYSCLENPMDREVWQTTVHGIAKSRTRLSNFTSVRVHLLCLQKQKVGKTPMKNYKTKTITSCPDVNFEYFKNTLVRYLTMQHPLHSQRPIEATVPNSTSTKHILGLHW